MNTYDFLTAKRQAEQEARAYAILSGGTSPGKAAVLRRAVEQAATTLSEFTVFPYPILISFISSPFEVHISCLVYR